MREESLVESISGLFGGLLDILWTGITSRSTQDFYNRFSNRYEDFFQTQPRYAADACDILRSYLAYHNLRFGTALECGCGTGVYTAELESICDELHCLDFSCGQLSLFSEKGFRSPAVQGNVLSLPYADESFDLVTSLGMMRHLPGEMMDAYVREAYRVLRPGGILYCEPCPLSPASLPNHRMGKLLTDAYNAFMAWRGLDEHLGMMAGLRETLESAGYEVELREERQTYEYAVMMARKN